MHFKENAEVVTSKLNKIGNLDRVVVDPETDAVTHLIVKKGFFFTEDRVIDAKYVDITTQDKVVLKRDTPRLDDCPHFEESEFVPVGSLEDFNDKRSLEARKFLWYQASVRMPGDQRRSYPSDADKPLFYLKKRRNLPDEKIPLKEGATVTDISGTDLGKIHDILAESDSFRVTHILVSTGLVRKKIKLIPVNWIKELFEESVRLYLTRETFENLDSENSFITK